MARKKTQKQRKRNPNFQSVIIKRYRAARPEHYILDTDRNIYIEKVSTISRYGKGSRGPTTYNKIQKDITALSEGYGLNQKEINSARGLSRRLNNVMKLVKTDSKIAEIMEHRWRTSDAFEQFGYVDFKDLKQSDITKLVEMYVAESGIYNLPSLAAPEKRENGDMDWAWNS